MSQRRACRVLGQARSTKRHEAEPDPFEDRLREGIVAFAGRFGRYGHTLEEAVVLIERWRAEYNHLRPHSAFGYRPSAPGAWRVDDVPHSSPLPSDPGGHMRAA